MSKRITDLAKQFKEFKSKSEEFAEQTKKLNAEWNACEAELLDAMVEEGVSSVRIEGVGLFSFQTKNYLSVNAANKPKFFEYLQESGNGDLLKLDVNTKTLTAFLGQHLEKLIEDRIANGLDHVEARKDALQYLNDRGASYFSDRGISLRKA